MSAFSQKEYLLIDSNGSKHLLELFAIETAALKSTLIPSQSAKVFFPDSTMNSQNTNSNKYENR